MFAEWFQTVLEALGHPVARAVTLLISVSSFMVSVWVARRTHTAIAENEASRYYLHLDNCYADILKLGIQYPHLRQLEATRTAMEVEQYNCYAQIVWNFIETIHDKFRTEHSVMQTWGTAVIREANLHNAWIKAPENAIQYNEPFRNFVEQYRRNAQPPSA